MTPLNRAIEAIEKEKSKGTWLESSAYATSIEILRSLLPAEEEERKEIYQKGYSDGANAEYNTLKYNQNEKK